MFKKILVGIFSIIASIGMAIAAVNINTASQSELESLPGVGPAKAKAIIDYRKANGGFKHLEDLKNVKGIGDKSFQKLRSEISISGPTQVPHKSAMSAEHASKQSSSKSVAQSGPAAAKKARK